MDYDARDMLLTTDAPTDKIVYLASGSVPIDGYPTLFAHELPFIPLLGGYWSFSPTFDVCYEFWSGDFPSGNNTKFYKHELRVRSSATDVTIDTVDIAGDSKTAYYRIFGFEPSNSTADVAPLANSGDNFVIDSGYNYMKLYSSDTVVLGTAASVTVTHNLGYIPKVFAWFMDISNEVTPIIKGFDEFSFSSDVTMVVTTTNIIFSRSGTLNIPAIYYRIYLDE